MFAFLQSKLGIAEPGEGEYARQERQAQWEQQG